MTARGLVVEGLAKSFGGVRAVDGVSFAAAPGELVALLGPSGCGKTTTLRCIAGFEHPDAGRIMLDGTVLADGAGGAFVPPNRRRFGMVFQSYAVWPHMRVRENVAYPLKVQGGRSAAEIRARTQDALAMVGLAALAERYPGQLSGGEQQRVALARAVVMQPNALLFDEPLSNLDAKLRERMRFELLEIQAKLAVPAVYVTHDQTEAMVMSRTIVVMRQGRIAQAGTPQEIYDRPASRFVADFVGGCNFLPAEVIAGAPSGCVVRCALGEIACTGEAAPGEQVLLLLRPERVQLAGEPFMGPNAFPATVAARYFLGFGCEYVLDAGGVRLRAQADARLSFQPGQRVHARLEPAACRIIREQE